MNSLSINQQIPQKFIEQINQSIKCKPFIPYPNQPTNQSTNQPNNQIISIQNPSTNSLTTFINQFINQINHLITPFLNQLNNQVLKQAFNPSKHKSNKPPRYYALLG